MAEQLLGIIGGTGLGDALSAMIENAKHYDVNTPFGEPSDSIMVGHFRDRKIAFLNRHGKGHRFCPSSVPYQANIYALKELGVTSCIASGAVGSLREDICPGDLVIVDQLIDKTFRRPGSFFTGQGAVHCEFSHPYCDRLREVLLNVCKSIDVKIHDGGTYVAMEGPQFSTKAESLMHRQWGGDLIGMTACPEAKLAREAQMCFSLVAMPSDYDCWREHDSAENKQALLEEIIGNLNKCTANMIKLIEAVLKFEDLHFLDNCDCRRSLEMAVWTTPDQLGDKAASAMGVLRK